ncbi:MAG: hypothetical protein Q4E36_00515 [Bacillota bacterium]|nr:hypothetical protein [Bacillota bacterium]
MNQGPIIVNPKVFEDLGPEKIQKAKTKEDKKKKLADSDLVVYTLDEIREAIFD